jgi:hypothetical protein
MRYVVLIAVVLTTSLATAQESYLHAQFRREGARHVAHSASSPYQAVLIPCSPITLCISRSAT